MTYPREGHSRAPLSSGVVWTRIDCPDFGALQAKLRELQEDAFGPHLTQGQVTARACLCVVSSS